MYGQYTALITVSYKKALDHQNNGSYDFYLDAIRIYDPANDGAGSKVIEDAYVADGEGWPEYFELRNMIISKNDFNSMEEGSGSGIVFIDNTKDGNNQVTYSIADYTNYGPNNELYLAPGQAVAFEMNVPNPSDSCKVAGIHLAMKSVDGTAKVAVYDAAEVAVASLMLLAAPDVPEEEIPEPTDPETTEPTEPEKPEVFEPKKFSVQLSNSRPVVGTTVVITVTTSGDVDYITINGEKVTQYTTNRFSATRTWKVRYKAETVGKLPVSVQCYNSTLGASAPVTKTITVAQKSTLGNWMSFIGGWLSKWR